MLYLYSSVVDGSQLNMFFVKPNRFRVILGIASAFFELSSNDKVVATGSRKCFVCGSMKNGVCFREGDSAFFVVRPAAHVSNGCKSRNPPGSGKDIAKTKGVCREAESEGRWRQISGLTDRNHI